ncbi:MAG TPA: HAD-IA family hydrolase [Solirubrobacteraceae bacterium]
MSRGRSAPPRAILLDALGTLLELEPPAPLLRAELRRRLGVALSESDARRAIAAEIAYYRGHFDDGRDEASLAELRLRCAEVLREAIAEPARAGLPTPAVLVDSLLASLRFRAFPEVRVALSDYRDRGLRLVVVSNWDVSLHDRLRELGLTPMLDGVLTSAEAGARKPSAAIFERALGLAGVGSAEAIHVGDSIDEDVAGAEGAGIDPVLVRRDGTAGPTGVRTVTSLANPLW